MSGAQERKAINPRSNNPEWVGHGKGYRPAVRVEKHAPRIVREDTTPSYDTRNICFCSRKRCILGRVGVWVSTRKRLASVKDNDRVDKDKEKDKDKQR